MEQLSSAVFEHGIFKQWYYSRCAETH